MKAKKVMTKGEDGVVKVLKEAENVTHDTHTKSSAAESLQKWASLDGENSVPTKNVYTENKLHPSDKSSSKNDQKENLIYGNSSFLSRFIEYRNDGKMSCNMTTGIQKESEVCFKVESTISLESSIKVANQSSLDAQEKDKVQSHMTEIALRDHADNSSTEVIQDMLSIPVIDEKEDDTGENSDIISKQCSKSSVRSHSNDCLVKKVQVKIPSIRRVEEIRRRIEGNVENSKTVKESRSPLPKLKNHKVDLKSKSNAVSKEDGNKIEIRRNNSSTRDSPPRKVSFKVRSSINNGRISSSSLSSSRRSTASKVQHIDSRPNNLSSSKVAALASKFNAFIHENKDGKRTEVLPSDPKKFVTIPQLPVSSTKDLDTNSETSKGGLTTAMKKSLPSEKSSVFRRINNSLKKENGVSGSEQKSKPTQPLPLSKSVTKCGNVKAAIQIFENNSTTRPPSAKCNQESANDGGKSLGNSKMLESEQQLDIPEIKREPNYPRVIFKRDATLVRVTLECEDVLASNEDQHSKNYSEKIYIRSGDDKLDVQNENEVECGIEGKTDVEDNNLKNDSFAVNENDYSKNITTISIDNVSEQSEEQISIKIKPVVPGKNVVKDHTYKSLLDLRNNTDDDNYVKVLCKPDKVKHSAVSECKTENEEIKNNIDCVPEKQAIEAECYSNKVYEIGLVQQKESPSVTPNKSFLWGISPPSSKTNITENLSSVYTAVPAIVTKDNERSPKESAQITEDVIGTVCDTYDDVYPPSTIDSTDRQQGYSVIGPEEDLYDDVGPPVCEENLSSRLTGGKIVTSNNTEVDDTDNGYEFCGGSVNPALDQNYDDCEGEGYQCIGESNDNEDAESNIYDDVKSVTITDDTRSISNCYESIYSGGDRLGTGGGTTTGDSSTLRTGVSSSASSSIGSGNHSFCDQSNSLYGIGGSKFDSASVSQASTVSADYGPHEVRSYQLQSMRPGQPRSETSDEWVDVEMTDSETEAGAIPGYHGRTRSRRSPRRSRKVRKPWSKTARKAAGIEENVFVSSSSVLYLGDPDPPACSHQHFSGSAGLVSLRAILYVGDAHESQEMTFFLEKEGGENSSDSDAYNPHDEMIYEEVDPKNEVHYDDFDSSNSEVSDETYIKPLHQAGYDIGNGQLPEPPPGQNIYGISKIAEAGKKMLKFGRTLRKIRNKRNNSPQACPPLPSRPPPSSVPPTLPSRAVPPPRMSDKSVSSGNLSGRKYWSLRKFKRSVSASDQVLPSSASSGSTFYISQVQDDDGGVVNKNIMYRKSVDSQEFCSENGDTTSPSSVSSSKTLVYDSGLEAYGVKDKSKRGSVSSTNSKKQRPTSAPERRSSGNVRPNSPPPLPPQPTSSSDNPKRPPRKENSGNTSWYAEHILFNQSTDTQNSIKDTPKKNVTKQEKPILNSWYAEIGLWDMSTSSPNDSSLSEQDARSQQTDLSGGDSSMSATSPENSGVVERRFADEPLYQFYAASVVERDLRSELDSDGYEEIGDGTQKQQTRPTAMELIKPREGQHRTLWCEIPEVLNSHILSTISARQKKLQEAKFEIITSEASYINSLSVLEKHFMSSPDLSDESILSRNDRRILFSNVIPVKTCSERFLADLEECWQDNILLHGICDVVYKHADKYFNIYIKYCSNQIYLDRTLRGLKEQNGRFSEVLTHLESSPICQALSLHSFLMLPMQRITRLPLLIDAVLTRLDPQDTEYELCRMALATVNKIVQECNEGARKMERMEEILILNHQLGFPKEIKPVPIISSSRWLVKAGEVTQLIWRGDEGKLTFGKKFSKIPLHLFLFNDLLFVTSKKKSDDCYVVVDYCPRNLIEMTSTEGMSTLPIKFTADGGRNLILLTMLQNHENKTVELILSCPLESDRQRWLEAVRQPISDNPNETVYEEWDCPQVRAIHSYAPSQPDELSLNVGDVVNVLRKITDGWYQGERIRDGERGWFPGNYTVEILSAHVRARNLKQRYRLLALSGNFLESQRKEKQVK